MDDGTPPAPPLRVLDLGTQVAGPFAASLLADMGAEVVKVERPAGGDPIRQRTGLSPRWQVEGRGKRSATCDLRQPEGQELLARLAGWADVLIENFRPGTMESWGLGYGALSARWPRLVYVSVSGFGQDGPYRQRPAYNDIGSAFAGLTWLTGTADGPPATPGLFVVDYMTGMLAALGALEALRRRDAAGPAGRGSWVDCAMYEAVLRLAGRDMVERSLTGVLRGRAGHAPLATADGRWLVVSAVTDDQFLRLAQLVADPLLADPALATPAGRQERAAEVDAALRRWAAGLDLAGALEALVGAGVPASPVNSVADLVADPHVVARGAVQRVANARGDTVEMPAPVPRFDAQVAGPSTPAEELGASNEEVWLGLAGLDRARYDDLVRRRVI
jgi:formyl-CoA transferase